MEKPLERSLALLREAQSAWDLTFQRFAASGLDLSREYASLQQSSIDELNARLHATFAIASGLSAVDDEGAASLIKPRIPQINSMLSAIKLNSEQITAIFSGHPSAIATDPDGNLQIQFSQGGGTVATTGIGQHLEPLSTQQHALLDQLLLGLRLGRNKGHRYFQELAKDAQLSVGETKTILNAAIVAKNELTDLVQRVTTTSQLATDSQRAIDETRQSTLAALEEAKKALSEIEAKVAAIREVSKNSDALQTTVAGYDSSFRSFQTALDSRVAEHDKLVAGLNEAMRTNADREIEIARLVTKADTMIRGATTAGLSHSLETTQSAYEKRLQRTGWWFLGSVVLLLICSIPIAGQLVPGPWQAWFAPSPGGSTDPWLATLGKLILLIPATWATAFFASNYSELFHLSREYAHKAALAKAVEGFKREAPQYSEEIVAGVFMEIRDNPGSRKSPEPAAPQNPIAKRILDHILDAIGRKKA